MKKYLLFPLLLFLTTNVEAQESKYDTTAIYILDHMSSIIGDLSSCTYTLHTSSDDLSKEGLGLITNFSTHEVMLQGPNKIQVNSNGDKGHRGFWYNGEQFAFYSYDENNYSIVDAPSTILETIDTIHMLYGIDFPASDFFYPTFTDDLIDNFDRIVYTGKSKIEGKECFKILATNDEMITQLWIADDAMTLPLKIMIMYQGKDNTPQYEATFTNWQINPVLPESVFEFLPPPHARQIIMLTK
jgi:hypothetical protein